ncbi:MAG: hypothetical protein IT301_01380 [Dehalococcoidia bacterium]|nr:hypothetical protein [Dehalococcoidia bacterium]
MTVLQQPRRAAGVGLQVRTPKDFGLGVAVSAALAAIVGLVLLAAAAMAGAGPRGEGHAPFDQPAVSGFESVAPAPPLLPQR